MSKNNESNLNIEIVDEVRDGVYSNLAIVSNSFTEFIIDFARVYPENDKAKVKTRIIMTPEHAKRLMFALTENIKKLEEVKGIIKLDANPNNIGQMIFNKPSQA